MAVLIALLFVAAVAGAFAVGSDDPKGADVRTDPTPGAAEGPGGDTDRPADEPPAPGSPGSVDPGRSTGRTVPSSLAGKDAPTTPTSGPQPAPTQAPADGTYKAKVTWQTEAPSRADGTGDATIRISTTGRTPSEVRQHHETQTSMSQKDGKRQESPPTRRDMRWTAEALYGSASSGDGSTCEPQETVDLQLPLREGLRWSSKAVCTTETGNGRMTSTTEATSEVAGSRQVTATGRQMLVWEIVVESKSKQEGGRAMGGSFTTNSTRLFSPELGVDVRVDMTMSNSFLRYKSTTEIVSIERS